MIRIGFSLILQSKGLEIKMLTHDILLIDFPGMPVFCGMVEIRVFLVKMSPTIYL